MPHGRSAPDREYTVVAHESMRNLNPTLIRTPGPSDCVFSRGELPESRLRKKCLLYCSGFQYIPGSAKSGDLQS
ncbi:MAG TPA: hypothetical protein DEB39_02565 [Planctomycetaceae bacterium]|nr:hypothetical protein [Planctomycetaceae bacterium]